MGIICRYVSVILGIKRRVIFITKINYIHKKKLNKYPTFNMAFKFKGGIFKYTLYVYILLYKM